MRITALGHAGLRVGSGDASVLLDPWLSPYGAFQCSWFQYPDNSHLTQDASLFAPAAVVVSHEHLDHLDAWFLARLAEWVPVFVPKYPSPVVRRKIEAARPGGPIREVDPWQWIDIAPGTRAMTVPESSPMNHDSAVVIEQEGRVLVNLNDARLSPAQLRDIRSRTGGRVDVLALQGAGASWHPMCYEWDVSRKRTLARQKRIAKLNYAMRAIKAVEPTVVLPFAGPPCFLDPDLEQYNAEMDGGVFPDQFDVAIWLRRRGVEDVRVLLPGDTWDTETRLHDQDPTWIGFDPSERQSYLKSYAERRAPFLETGLRMYPPPTRSLWPAFAAYFTDLIGKSPYFNGRINMRVGFDISGPGGGEWAVDFRQDTLGVYSEPGACQYRYRFASRWLAPILHGRILWEDFLLSLRFQAWREPDIHNEHLLGLLKFADTQAFDAVESYEAMLSASDRIVIYSGNEGWSVPRYCPHAGADLLETSEILPGGVLRCLSHYYEFDLKTGSCLNGQCAPLDVVAVSADGGDELPSIGSRPAPQVR